MSSSRERTTRSVPVDVSVIFRRKARSSAWAFGSTAEMEITRSAIFEKRPILPGLSAGGALNLKG